jgi:hypothetical protein
MATRRRPPEDPEARARYLSTVLITAAEQRSLYRTGRSDRPLLQAADFLSEGFAVGDIEATLDLMFLNLFEWTESRYGNSKGFYPGVIDSDGIVPIDVLGSPVINTLPEAKYLGGGINAFDLAMVLPRERIEQLSPIWTVRGVIEAVQSRLQTFLTVRIKASGGNQDPIKGKSGTDPRGGASAVSSKETPAAAQDDREVASAEVDTAVDHQIRPRRRSVGAAAAGFTGMPSLYEVTVHADEAGLRIYDSPAYFLNWSLVFGSPTPSVTGWVYAGRHKFGAMDPSGRFRFDTSNFDIPPLKDFKLILKA